MVINDPFDSGDLSHWTLGAGWQLVASENGQALQVSGSDEAATLLQNTLGDRAAQMRVLMNTGLARLSLRQSEAGAYTLVLDMNGSVSLYRNTQQIGAAQVSPTIQRQWRIVRLSVIGSVLRVAVDGIEVIAMQDAAPLPPGTLSFGGYGLTEGALRVDDVVVWVPVGTETATETPTDVATLASPTTEPELNMLFNEGFDDNGLQVWMLDTHWRDGFMGNRFSDCII